MARQFRKLWRNWQRLPRFSLRTGFEQRFGGQIIEAPALSLTENVVEMPVTQTQEKMQQVANTHVQNVVNTINVEKPKIVKQTVSICLPDLECQNSW